jgi:hypothetical protein
VSREWRRARTPGVAPLNATRSHSEPHIAQSPLDPNLLIAASKRYDRDPDSLAEYEFKIGTYVSFDHGVTWSDLGQLNARGGSIA